jgi:hypothetical protein
MSSSETKRRITSTVVLAVVSSVAFALDAVLKDAAFRQYLIDLGVGSNLVPLITVFGYQFVASIINHIPKDIENTTEGIVAGSSNKDNVLI